MADSTPIANHTVKAGETLSEIALKYYGSALREKWMLIYEANKAVIGDNPGMLRPGIVLNIPPEHAQSVPETEDKTKKSQRPDMHIQS